MSRLRLHRVVRTVAARAAIVTDSAAANVVAGEMQESAADKSSGLSVALGEEGRHRRIRSGFVDEVAIAVLDLRVEHRVAVPHIVRQLLVTQAGNDSREGDVHIRIEPNVRGEVGMRTTVLDPEP